METTLRGRPASARTGRFSRRELRPLRRRHGREELRGSLVEFRHFETIFLSGTEGSHYVTARVFDLFEELDFAGHPVLGAAAVPHERDGTAGELPGTDSRRLADPAARHDPALTPGFHFSPDGALDHYLRLPFTLPAEAIDTAVDRLTEATPL
ncbi:MAG TPA: hypothetical protein VIS09_22550 [Streptomyces sp.]